MKWLMILFRRLRSIFRRETVDRELDEEMRFHLERQLQADIQAGMAPEEARHATLRRFGSVDKVKEECRDINGLPWLEHLLQDVRFGLRMLLKSPGFTAVAVLSLALGIGGNTAIYSVVNDVLLNPLPQTDPERLVAIRSVEKQHGWSGGVSPQTWQDLLQTTNLVSDLVVSSSERLYWQGEYFVEDVDALRVSPNFFSFWQLHPQLGRTFTAEEVMPGAPPVIILSHEFWQNQCEGRHAIVGQTIRFQEKAFTVVGVMPPSGTLQDTIGIFGRSRRVSC